MVYEEFRTRLETMACEDEHHARLLREHIEALGGTEAEEVAAGEILQDRQGEPPWKCLLRALADKRELYERYRDGASAMDEADLRALMLQLKEREGIHLEQIIELLTKVDGHVHST